LWVTQSQKFRLGADNSSDRVRDGPMLDVE
jgi:hypothetical protein